MQWWEAVTWNVARAGGFTAYGLLTLAVAVGLAMTLRWQSQQWPRLLNSEMHNFLTLLSVVFLVVHISAIFADPFTHFGVAAILIPFASDYRPLWMGLGIVALYLGVAIGISTWLRPKIGYRRWRQLHTLTLGVYALATVHGIFTGSDSHNWWAIAIYSSSIVLVGTLLWQRLETPAPATTRAQPAPQRQRQVR